MLFSRLIAVLAMTFALTRVETALAQGSGEAPLLSASAGECAEAPEFTHVLTGEPLPQFMPDEEITPAVDDFHCSAENAYAGDEAAIAEGKSLFRLCGSCHGTQAEGRIGPSLVDETVKYESVTKEHGEFEVIYGGAAGAMQPMGRRFTQDEILKIMAYIGTLGGQ